MNLTTSQIISKSFRDLFQKEIRNIILICFLLTSFFVLTAIYFFYVKFINPLLDNFYLFLKEYVAEIYFLNYLLTFKFFYYILNLFKFFFIFLKFFALWFLISIIIMPINNFITGFFIEIIFFNINKLNDYKWKFILKKNSFFLCFSSSCLFVLKSICLNIILLPFYFFLPIANIFIFISVNSFLNGKELCKSILVQFFDLDDLKLKNFYKINRGKIYFIGCINTAMQLIPIVNFFFTSFSAIITSHLILDYFNIKKLRKNYNEKT